MKNSEFLEKAFSNSGPKVITGFSRPIYHNIMGLLHGHQYGKKTYGGMIRHTEAGMLFQWAKNLPPDAVVVEIGCYGGLSTSYLLSGLSAGSGGEVFAIDPFNSDIEKQVELTDNRVSLEQKPSKELVCGRLEASGFKGMFNLIEGYSQDAAHAWSKPINFLWIDGNHEQAYQDYLDFKAHLKPGSRVAVHDAHPRYGYQSVVDDVRKIFANDDEWRSLEHVKSIISGIRL